MRNKNKMFPIHFPKYFVDKLNVNTPLHLFWLVFSRYFHKLDKILVEDFFPFYQISTRIWICFFFTWCIPINESRKQIFLPVLLRPGQDPSAWVRKTQFNFTFSCNALLYSEVFTNFYIRLIDHFIDLCLFSTRIIYFF